MKEMFSFANISEKSQPLMRTGKIMMDVASFHDDILSDTREMMDNYRSSRRLQAGNYKEIELHESSFSDRVADDDPDVSD